MRVLAAKTASALTMAACLSACAYGGDFHYERQHGTNPPLGQVTSVTPGDVVFTEFDFTTAAAAVVAGGFTDYIQLTKVVIAPGSVLLKAGDDYCTANNTLFALAGNPVGVACLRDTDGDGMFDRIAGGNLIATDFPPLPYRSDAVGTGTGFRKELLYQGVQGDTVRLSYREFDNDMARPAFQQELTYNLEKPGPTRVTFKGVKIDIAGADNNGLKYTVLTGFSGQ